jgi:hypothetical protein
MIAMMSSMKSLDMREPDIDEALSHHAILELTAGDRPSRPRPQVPSTEQPGASFEARPLQPVRCEMLRSMLRDDV